MAKKKNEFRSGDKVLVTFETEVMDYDDEGFGDRNAVCICMLGSGNKNKIDKGYLRRLIEHANGKVYRLKKS